MDLAKTGWLSAALASAVYAAALLAGTLAILVVLSSFGILARQSPFAESSELGRGVLLYASMLCWALGVGRLCRRWFGRTCAIEPSAIPGLGLGSGLLRPTLLAALLGLCGVGAGVVVGGGRPGAPLQTPLLSVAALLVEVLVFLLIAAALEEVVFRGFLLRLWQRSCGAGWALVLTSSAFALVHTGNPASAPLALLNTFLAGLVLATLALRSSSLWPPLLLHFVWNAAQGPLLGLPVSGQPAPVALWQFEQGSNHLAGGSYGFEGGLGATLVLLSCWWAAAHLGAFGRKRP